MDGIDDHQNDKMPDPTSLKRKRTSLSDYFEQDEAPKRHDSKSSLDRNTNMRPQASDQTRSSPDLRRDHSPSADSRSPSRRKRARYSPETPPSHEADKDRARRRTNSPHYNSKDLRDRDDSRYDSERDTSRGSSERYRERGQDRDRDRDQRDVVREPRRVSSSDRDYGGHDSERSWRRQSSDKIPTGPASQADIERDWRAREAAEYKKKLNKEMAESGRNNDPHSPVRVDRSSRDMQAPILSRRPISRENDSSVRHSPRENGDFSGTKFGPSASKDITDSMRELMTTLGQFGENIMEQSSLKIQRDALRISVKRKLADFEKSRPHLVDFPAVAESQKAGLEKARKELEAVEQLLEQKQASTAETTQKIATKFVPSNQGSNSAPLDELRDRVESLSNIQDSFKMKLDTEHQKWSDAQSNRGLIGDDQNKLSKNLEDLISIPDTLQEVISTSRDEFTSITSKISKLESRVEEMMTIKIPPALKTEHEALALHVENLVDEIKGISKAQIEMKSIGSPSDIVNLKQEMEKLKNEVYGLGNNYPVRHHVLNLEENYGKLIKAMTELQQWINDDMGSDARSKLTVLEESLRKLERRFEGFELRHSNEAPSEPTVSSAVVDTLKDRLDSVERRHLHGTSGEAPVSSAILDTLKDLQNEQQALSISQDAVGEGLDEVNNEVNQVRNAQNEFKSEVQLLRTSLEAQMKSHDELREKTVEAILALQTDTRPTQKNVQDETVATVELQQQSPSGMQPGQNMKALDTRLNGLEQRIDGFQLSFGNPLNANLQYFANSVEALKLGQNNLETRFNNLSTESLARQIFGQVEQVYPNLRNNEQIIAALSNTLTEQINRIQAVDGRVNAMEKQSSSPISNKDIQGPSNGDLIKLSGSVASIKADLDASKAHFSQQHDGLVTNIANLSLDFDDTKNHMEKDMDKAKTTIGLHEGYIARLNHDVQVLKNRGIELDKAFDNVNTAIGNLQDQGSTPSPPPTTSRLGHLRAVSKHQTETCKKLNGQKRKPGPFIDSDHDDD